MDQKDIDALLRMAERAFKGGRLLKQAESLEEEDLRDLEVLFSDLRRSIREIRVKIQTR